MFQFSKGCCHSVLLVAIVRVSKCCLLLFASFELDGMHAKHDNRYLKVNVPEEVLSYV